jgi:hypothetical protein
MAKDYLDMMWRGSHPRARLPNFVFTVSSELLHTCCCACWSSA